LDLLESGVLAAYPLAGGKANAPSAVLDGQDQGRQENRIVLAVAVKCCDDRAARRADAAANGGGLPQRCLVAQCAQILALLHGVTNSLRCLVCRTIIDVDD